MGGRILAEILRKAKDDVNGHDSFAAEQGEVRRDSGAAMASRPHGEYGRGKVFLPVGFTLMAQGSQDLLEGPVSSFYRVTFRIVRGGVCLLNLQLLTHILE